MPGKGLTSIIPQKKKEIPLYLNFLFWAAIILILATLILIFFINNRIESAKAEIAQMDSQISAESKTKTSQELLETSRKIESFRSLLDNHKYPTKFIEFLKEITHPKTSLYFLNVNTNDLVVSMSGRSQNLESIGEQLFILKQREEIKGLTIQNVSLTREGDVDFRVNFDFSEDLIKK